MPEELYSQLITAGIALISVFVGFLLQSFSQRKNRQWILDDRKFQRRVEVLNLRLKESENLINQYFYVANHLIQYETGLVISKGKTNDISKLDEVNRLMTENTKMIASLLNLNDAELVNLNGQLLDCVSVEMKVAYSLAERLKDSEIIEPVTEHVRLQNFYTKVATTRQHMMKRIDELSGFNN